MIEIAIGAAVVLALVAFVIMRRKKQPTSGWQSGPVINGKNYSKGCRITKEAGAVISFPISPTDEPHYVTVPCGSLAGKRSIRARFKIEGPADAVIHGAGDSPLQQSAITLYFEVEKPNWQADGGRWWASGSTYRPLLVNNEFEVVASFSDQWTSVLTMTSTKNPGRFAKDRTDAGRIGFTFANSSGWGHGAMASEPVKFTLLKWAVD